jgi:hypothetical protein
VENVSKAFYHSRREWIVVIFSMKMLDIVSTSFILILNIAFKYSRYPVNHILIFGILLLVAVKVLINFIYPIVELHFWLLLKYWESFHQILLNPICLWLIVHISFKSIVAMILRSILFFMVISVYVIVVDSLVGLLRKRGISFESHQTLVL